MCREAYQGEPEFSGETEGRCETCKKNKEELAKKINAKVGAPIYAPKVEIPTTVINGVKWINARDLGRI